MATATKTRRKPATDKPKFDPYAAVTDRIVALMDAGTNPWRKPWSAGANSFPLRMSTGKPYRGVNVFLLLMAAMDKGYTSPWWGTYDMITAKGGQVREGEKSTQVVFWSTFPSKNPDEIDPKTGKPKMIFFLKTFRVFNAAQADNLPTQYLPEPPPVRSEFEAHEAAAAVLDDYWKRAGIKVTHGGGRAAYSPTLDTVVLPEPETFTVNSEYYSTAAHEAAHSTGHASRLGRPDLATFAHFGDQHYSREELVAELTSAMVCGITGVALPETEANSAAYLAGWAKALRGDSRLVVQAASKAHAAADLILGIDRADNESEPAA